MDLFTKKPDLWEPGGMLSPEEVSRIAKEILEEVRAEMERQFNKIKSQDK